MISKTYQIQGMTCAHCASSVSAELFAVSGVSDVKVDVPSGRVEVTSDLSLDEQVVRAAVDKAGYVLAHPGQLPLA